MAIEMQTGTAQDQGRAAAAAKEAAKAVQTAAAVTAATIVGGGVAGAVTYGVKSALDTLDSLQLTQLKQMLETGAGRQMVDEALAAIVKADKETDKAPTLMGKLAPMLRGVAARMSFADKVAAASTDENRAARDHAVDVMAKPNGRHTEEALHFILDTINQELDNRADTPNVLPVPVPFLPTGFCGTTIKFPR